MVDLLLPLLLLVPSMAAIGLRSDLQISASLNYTYNNGSVSKYQLETYNFNWSAQSGIVPFRFLVQVLSDESNHTWPLVVLARQGYSVINTQLPYDFPEHVDSYVYKPTVYYTTYYSVARTVCPRDSDKSNEAVVTFSSQASVPIKFSLTGSLVENYVLELNSPIAVELQPSMQQYFYFNFSSNENTTGLNAVRALVESNDSVCMIMVVRSFGCPVMDNPLTIDHSGLSEKVLNKGDIQITRNEFPTGFILILLSYPTNRPCTGEDKSVKQQWTSLTVSNSTKSLTVTIVQAPEATAAVYIWVSVFWILVFLVSVIAAAYTFRSRRPEAQQFDQFQSSVQPPTELPTEMSVAVMLLKKGEQGAPTKKHTYALQLVVICLFYSLPVIQMMITLLNNAYKSGDLDSCFYNYACANKLYVFDHFFIYAFNSVFSNIGYIAVGLAFIVVCAIKHFCQGDRTTGLPETYCLYYACGAAIAMEGVMSGAYHLCPTHYNFQFDTAFMIMIAGLLILLLYSKRHPNHTPVACIAYLAFGAFILANTLGILFAWRARAAVFSILVALHLILTVYLIRQVYFFGTLSWGVKMQFDFSTSYPADKGCDNLRSFLAHRCRIQAKYPSTLVFLTVVALANVLFALLCILCASGNLSWSFGTVFLALVVMNFLLYLFYYLIRKLGALIQSDFTYCCLIITLIAFVSTAVLSGFALKYYDEAPTSWNVSPAESRSRNSECMLLKQFDVHDLWHYLSAAALYSLLLLILCVDLNDEKKSRENLPVF